MIPYPQLDSRDEEQVVASVIDALPPELSDRNASSVAVKLIEGVGAFYGLLLYKMSGLPRALHIALLNLVGIEPFAASSARVELVFTSADGTLAPIPILAGTRVRTGFSVGAQEFATEEDASVPEAGGSEVVWAHAIEPGAAGNVGVGSLIYLDQPIAGIAGVTNPGAAFGGQDAEELEATLARAPAALRNLGDRLVTAEDAEQLATGVPGVVRAKARGASYLNESLAIIAGAGVLVVGTLASDLNQTPSSALMDAVRDELLARAPPGLLVSTYQHPTRLVWVSQVELALEVGYTLVGIKPAVEAALAEYLDARRWEWGASLFENDLVVQLARVAGVRRVGAMEVRLSDDYGASWSAPATLVTVAPGPAGDLTDAFGLLHWGEGFGTHGPLDLVAL